MKTSLLRRRGFTLIELIVVILILAILAALIVPRVMSRADDAKRTRAQSDIKSLSSALQLFRADVGRYPTTEEGLEALRRNPGDAPGWREPYLERPVPQDPWGNPYIYEGPEMTGTGSFVIVSYGSDGQPGGEGDAEDIIVGLDDDL
jgi:general secretion pathway protein G